MGCRQALSVYRGHSWCFIEEHIHDTLGRSYRELGDLQSAVHHFMAILPCPQATTALQGRYLQQFLDAVHQAGAAQVGSSGVCSKVVRGPWSVINGSFTGSAGSQQGVPCGDRTIRVLRDSCGGAGGSRGGKGPIVYPLY